MFSVFRKSILLAAALLLIGSGVAEAALNHDVVPGDTVWLLSQKYGTTVAAVAGANDLKNPELIYSGQQLLIPDRHRVVAGESVWLISQKYGTTIEAIAGASSLSNPALIYPDQILALCGNGGGGGEGGSGEEAAPVLSRSNSKLAMADLDLFACLVHAESAGEPFSGQVAVAATVLNRVQDGRYPSSVREVIMEVASGFYQYSPVQDGRIGLPASDDAYRAVQEALNGADPSRGATGFYNPAKTTNLWVRMQPVTITIGNHVFFR